MENEAIEFLGQILKEAKTKKIDLKKWPIDHICFRTISEEDYIHTKTIFQSLGDQIIESMVGGRLIATYKLKKPLVYGQYIIDLVEVPAPKPGKIVKRGFEHIELVVDLSLEELQNIFPLHKILSKKSIGQVNPEMEIKLDCGCVKFHFKSLEDVIEIEKNVMINEFLEETKLLFDFHQFNPCLSGSLPLKIAVKNSDLDILFDCSDFDLFKKQAQDKFGRIKDFKIIEKNNSMGHYILVNFTYKNLPIEFFCSKIKALKNMANSHFLIESRLLKIFGARLRLKVIELKQSGLTTEEAFGKALNIENPYERLIELNQFSDVELRNTLALK